MEQVINNTAIKALLHRANARGKADYGWLKTAYSFSFAQYYNPENIHFGALRVLNDDVVAPSKGFDTHPHDNMEIITIPLFGTLRHKDSIGHIEDIVPHEVQVMSAGTGVFHSEYNPSSTESVGLFQIWIIPDERNVKPVYDQRVFNAEGAQNQWQRLVGPVGEGGDNLTIHQQAYISRVFLSKGSRIDYTPLDESFGSYLMVADGAVDVEGVKLNLRDALGIYNTGKFTVEALEDSYLVNIEVPDLPKR